MFANVDTEGPRFKGFEKWWSSFYMMNAAEIRWIVENLFIGNKLQCGVAALGRGAVDLREIQAPIIVFASKGDDITPPPQALNWIAEVYGDQREIRARGQKILYIVHEEIGHLGIFVSAKVARKEHDRIVTTLEAVEALGRDSTRCTSKKSPPMAPTPVMSSASRSAPSPTSARSTTARMTKRPSPSSRDCRNSGSTFMRSRRGRWSRRW